MDTKALRQKILDLAIRGKLVPQDPTDEPASVLLERIREEKNQMVKDGKLKAKDIKNDTIIFKGDDNLHYEKFQDGTVKCIEDEIPFEVPEAWEWSRLSSITTVITDGEHKTPLRCEEYTGYYLLSARNIHDSFIRLEDVDYVDEAEYNRISPRCNPRKDDVLISCSGTVGRVAVVNDDNNYVMVRSAAMIRMCEINPEYTMFALQSSVVQKQMQLLSKQTAQANLFQGAIASLLVPIPSLTEQVSISQKAKQLLYLNDTIGNEKQSLLQSIIRIKAHILDLAIKGKLAPQSPDDEPASVLLERIRTEKEKLIKQGKLKRDKKESIIYKGDDNSYYGELDIQIPQAWKIVSLQEINTYCTVSINPALNPEATYELYSVPIYETGYPEIIKGKEIGSTKQQIQKDDVLISKINPRINRVWRNHKFTDNNTICSSEWIVFRNSNLYAPYMQIYFMSPFFRKYMLSNVSGVGGSLMRAQPESVRKYPVIIPPYNEQVRIVSLYRKINEQLNCIKHKLE